MILAIGIGAVVLGGSTAAGLVFRSARNATRFLLEYAKAERDALRAASDEHDLDAQLKLAGLDDRHPESVVLTTEDGVRLSGHYFPSNNGAAIVCVHGFRAAGAAMIGAAAPLLLAGYGGLIFDLRAHGDSDGERLNHGHRELTDLQAAFEYVGARTDVDADRIGMIGHSMGGTFSILYASSNPDVAALAVDSPYARFDAKTLQGFLGFGRPRTDVVLRLVESELDADMGSIAAVDRIGAIDPRPVLMMAGERDGIVPVAHAHDLTAAAGDNTTTWIEPDLAHLEFSSGAEDYPRRVLEFFDAALAGTDHVD